MIDDLLTDVQVTVDDLAAAHSYGKQDGMRELLDAARWMQVAHIQRTLDVLEPLRAILGQRGAKSLHVDPQVGRVRVLFVVNEDLYYSDAFLQAYEVVSASEKKLSQEGIDAWVSFTPFTEHIDYSAIGADYAIQFPKQNPSRLA